MVNRLDQWTAQLVELPRIVRIIIAGFFALMVVFLLFPLIDHIYIRFFFTVETTMIPALLTVSIGAVAYLIGWQIYVGTIDSKRSAQKVVLWYFVIGLIVTLLVAGLFMYGVVSLNAPVDAL